MGPGLEEYGPVVGGPATPSDRLTERIADAMSRNGLNTLLLDLKTDLGVIAVDMRHLVRRQDDFQSEVRRRLDHADDSREQLHIKVNANTAETASMRTTLNRIAPMVDAHEKQNVEREALRNAISKWMGRGRLIYGAAVALLGAAAGWLAAHFPTIAAWFTGPKP